MDDSRARRFTAAAVVACPAGVPLWLFAPVDTCAGRGAPVVNQTALRELEPYRRALTQELIAELSDSAVVRVLPYDRELQILRRFRTGGHDFSSREAIQALTANSGAPIVIRPRCCRERRMASAGRIPRCDDRDQRRCAGDGSGRLVADQRDRVWPHAEAECGDRHAISLRSRSRRVTLAHEVRRIGGRAEPAPQARMRTLDAAAAFERGLDAYEQMEYGACFVRSATRSHRIRETHRSSHGARSSRTSCAATMMPLPRQNKRCGC